jgi:hypothetical protein
MIAISTMRSAPERPVVSTSATRNRVFEMSLGSVTPVVSTR